MSVSAARLLSVTKTPWLGGVGLIHISYSATKCSRCCWKLLFRCVWSLINEMEILLKYPKNVKYPVLNILKVFLLSGHSLVHGILSLEGTSWVVFYC